MKNLFFLIVCLLLSSSIHAQVFCLNTVTNYPYTASFETGMDNWVNGNGTGSPVDNLNWIRRSGSTPTAGTGPNGAEDGNYYLYTSAAQNPNHAYYSGAVLYSPCFNLANAVRPAVTFKYNLHGAHSEVLYLQASSDGQNWTTVWRRSGDRTNTWRHVYVDLRNYNLTGFYIGNPPMLHLRFVSSVHDGALGDVAIDNIQVYSQPQYTLCDGYFQNGSLLYSFEDYVVGWTQATNDNGDWEEQSGPSPYNWTGPTTTPDGLDYLHLNEGFTNGQQAIITSPCIYLNNFHNPKLLFQYNLDDNRPNRFGFAGSLVVEVSTDGGTNWTYLATYSNYTNHSWMQASIDLSSYNSQTIKLRFTGTVIADVDLSLDAVKVVSTYNIFFKENEVSSSSSSLSDLEEASTLSVIPNPFQNHLTIQTTLPQAEGYRLTNLQGQIVQEGSLQSSQVAVQELPAGIYFLTVYNAEQQLTQKVMKQ